MGDSFTRGIFGPKTAATLLQVNCERFHDLFDILGCRILGMGHYVPIDVGSDTRFRVPCSSLHCIYRSTHVQQQRDRGVTQIVEAEAGRPFSRRICLNSRETLV